MDSKTAYALKLLYLTPQTWDIGGWAKFAQRYSLPKEIVNLEDEELPKSRKDFLQLADSFESMMRKASNTEIVSLDANDYGSPKWSETYQAWLQGCERKFFPAYVETVNLLTKNLLLENFRFKYAKDGSPVVYRKVYGSEALVWEEVENSDTPFSTLQGPLRLELEKTIVASSKAIEVDCFYKKDGKTSYSTGIPFYRLYERFREDFFKTITGNPELVSRVKTDFNETLEDLRRQHQGDLRRDEIKGGLVKVDEVLQEMDQKLHTYGWLYDQDFTPADLTNDKETDAFAYFDLEQIKEGDTPDFDGFLDAVVPDCRDSLMAAVYATVFAKSHLNQYIWLHGEGGDGKSSFLNALQKYLGPSLCCSLGQTMNSDFGLEEAVGKRMIILSDVKTGLSVKSQLIHNLTGHDPVSVNRKNRPIITTTLNPVLWIAANDAPDVNFDAANEARRCLYIKMQTPSIDTLKKFCFTDDSGNLVRDCNGRLINNGYDLTSGLVKEMPAILYKCRKVFEKVCPAPYSVILQQRRQQELAEINCVDLETTEAIAYIQEALDFGDPEARMRLPDIFEAIQDTRSAHGIRASLTNFNKRDIKRILVVRYGCRNKKANGIRYLSGVKRREP